jgi:hypothetical protein
MREAVGCYGYEMWAIYDQGKNVLFSMEMHYSKKKCKVLRKDRIQNG